MLSKSGTASDGSGVSRSRVQRGSSFVAKVGHRGRIATAFLITALLAGPVQAATIYWAGAAGNWSSGTSWVGGSAPGSSDTASFQGYASTAISSVTVPSSFDASTTGPKAIDG